MAFTDITKAVRLAEDYKNYQAWLTMSTQQRQTAFEAVNNPQNTVRTAREAGYVAPFNASGGTILWVPTRLIAASQSGRGSGLATTLKSIVDEYTKSVLGASDLAIVGVKKFKPAKLTVIQRVSTATTKETSRITKRKYYRHENDSVTTNFGKKAVGDTFEDVVTAIKAKSAFNGLFTGSANALASKYRFVPESV